MKKTAKLLALVMAIAMVLTLGLSACGSKSKEPPKEPNPFTDYVGNYVSDRASIFVGVINEKDGANALVNWSGSAWENSVWTMTGTFDAETSKFEYHDCVRTDYVYNENGEVESQEEVYTGGHGFMTFKKGDPKTLTWQDDQEHVADDMVFEYTGLMPGGSEESEEGLANPWTTADSLEAAAEGAGVDGFSIPEGAEISLGEVALNEARYMEGIAEAAVEYPAVEMTIRKGGDSAAQNGDISGDYNEYAYTWTQTIDGLEVTCFGNREGEATKTIWQTGDTYFSITAYGLGGDTDYGLSADDLSTLVSGIR